MRDDSPQRALLLLTGVATYLEVGLLVACLAMGASPWVTGFVLAAYHLGYVAADRVAALEHRILASAVTVAVLATTILFSWDQPLVAAPAVFVTAAGLQALRRRLKPLGQGPVVHKHISKFVAMCLAGAASTVAGLTLLGVAAAVAVQVVGTTHPLDRRVARRSEALGRSTERRLLATEFLHHAHYFLYCYTFWRLLDDLRFWAVGVMFSIGWVAYFVAEAALGQRRQFAPSLIGAGHLLCAVSIGGMTMVDSTIPLMVLWFLTGVGGGTAYLLSSGPQAVHRERAEDWGHVVGTLLGGMLAAVAVGLSIVAAAIVAAATASISFTLAARPQFPGGYFRATR